MSSIAHLFESGEQSGQKGHFLNLLMLARIDGKISTQENLLLNRVARRLSLTEEQVQEIMDNPGDYPMIPPVTREDRYERFIQLIQLLNVDGLSDREEENMVKRYGIALGFTPERIDEKFPIILEHLRKGMNRESVLEAVM
jgi:hypothetical protein